VGSLSAITIIKGQPDVRVLVSVANKGLGGCQKHGWVCDKFFFQKMLEGISFCCCCCPFSNGHFIIMARNFNEHLISTSENEQKREEQNNEEAHYR
jgi:hypothetical protein